MPGMRRAEFGQHEKAAGAIRERKDQAGIGRLYSKRVTLAKPMPVEQARLMFEGSDRSTAPASRSVAVASAATGRFDGCDIDLAHRHHRVESALCLGSACLHRFHQNARGDLPGDAPFILAPAALAFLATIADDGVPVAVGLFLIFRRDLEGESLAVLDRRAAIQADAGDA